MERDYKQERYIMEVITDDDGNKIFGEFIKESQYIRRKKLKKLKYEKGKKI